VAVANPSIRQMNDVLQAIHDHDIRFLSLTFIDVLGNTKHAQDIFHLVDRWGRRIDTPERQRALKASTALVKHSSHLLPQSGLSPDPFSRAAGAAFAAS